MDRHHSKTVFVIVLLPSLLPSLLLVLPGQALQSELLISFEFSFWWNHTRSPENFKGGSVRYAPVRKGYKPPEGSPEGVPFSEASTPPAERSEARLRRGSARRAKRGRPAVRSEAARRSSGGRHYKKTQKGSTRKPRGTTYFVVLFRVYG